MAVTQTYSLAWLDDLVDYLDGSTGLKIALMVPAFTFDAATHSAWADCSASEITAGNGYTTGGETLTSVAVSINTGDEQVDIDADSVTWEASGGAIADAASAIVYDTGSANRIIKHIAFGETLGTATGKLLQINLANGLAYLKTIAS